MSAATDGLSALVDLNALINASFGLLNMCLTDIATVFASHSAGFYSPHYPTSDGFDIGPIC